MHISICIIRIRVLVTSALKALIKESTNKIVDANIHTNINTVDQS